MESGRQKQLESAGRCIAAAMIERDRTTLAALLRAAAKYIEGSGGEVGSLAVMAMPNTRG